MLKTIKAAIREFFALKEDLSCTFAGVDWKLVDFTEEDDKLHYIATYLSGRNSDGGPTYSTRAFLGSNYGLGLSSTYDGAYAKALMYNPDLDK